MTFVHQILGRERIKQICKEKGLTPEDEKIIDNIFEKWDSLTGKVEEKVVVATREVKGNPRSQEIIHALLVINLEFLKKRFR